VRAFSRSLPKLLVIEVTITEGSDCVMKVFVELLSLLLFSKIFDYFRRARQVTDAT
jgi:hypothetical protein